VLGILDVLILHTEKDCPQLLRDGFYRLITVKDSIAVNPGNEFTTGSLDAKIDEDKALILGMILLQRMFSKLFRPSSYWIAGKSYSDVQGILLS
jgi:hypothetical protein